MTTSHRFPPSPSAPLPARSAGLRPQPAPGQTALAQAPRSGAPAQAFQQPLTRVSPDVGAPLPGGPVNAAAPGIVPPNAAPARPAPLPQAGLAHSAAADDAVVLTQDLTKTFGKRTVVEGLNLVVPRGSVYGFLGPNGSGKSTTMKMLLGLLAPTRGRISVLGRPFTPATRAEIMSRTGSMIENPPGYGHLTGAENMRIAAKMQGLSDQQVSRALALVRLTEHKDRLVRTYSLGMKQRLGIALALAREPELLILDEPTNGLDPAGIEEVRRLLVELAGEGVTVMVSSHLLDEIDRMASTLGILSAGRLVFQGTRAELMERSVPDILIVTPTPQAVLDPQVLAGLVPSQAPGQAASTAAPGAPGPADPAAGPVLTAQGVRIPGLSKESVAELISRLAAAGVELHEVRRETQSLEDVFMDLTGRGGVL
ncbi:ABC transporter ATP-binding protein [Actinomyces viscosus]|uniref:ABC transporter ATP-binding protein n=1 Tax=Actinomyces viscosus TaxID=1656 RepID=UPI0028E3E004|nr:ABC transporter ATP-binding protein [Actinomyces viscosus]